LRDQRIDIRQSANDRLADAATSLNRELELAQQGANALVGIESQLWQTRIGMAQSGAAAMGAAPVSGGYGGVGGNVNFNISGSNMTPNQIDAQIRQAMTGMGVIPN